MKGATAAAAGALLAAGAVQAQDGVVRWDIQRRGLNLQPRVSRRASSTVDSSIANNQALGGYFASCSIGTPAQKLTLQLDTGSSDIWAPYTGASICQESQSNPSGCSLGAFNPDNSTTFHDIGKGEFDISYVDGSSSKGDYISDVFTIGGTTLSNVTMGLGIDTSIPYGLVGVGYKDDEAIVSTDQSLQAAYPNLPVLLMKDGKISTIAYSLWLNDLDASTGSILFGGIDTDQYHGDLITVNVQKNPQVGVFDSFLVELTAVEAVSHSGSDTLPSPEYPIGVVLDSGTTLSYLPQDLAEEIWQEVGASYSGNQQAATIPCSMGSSSGYFSFAFGGSGGAVVNVSMSELVIPLTTSGPTVTFNSGSNKGKAECIFGIQNQTVSAGADYLLGDSFLRSAYVVYDLVNNQIGLASTNFNATSTNVVAFASSGAPIPSATAAPNQAQVSSASSSTSPNFSAESGFGSGNKNAGSMPSALEFSQLGVMGVSVFFAMVGSGFFMLF